MIRNLNDVQSQLRQTLEETRRRASEISWVAYQKAIRQAYDLGAGTRSDRPPVMNDFVREFIADFSNIIAHEMQEHYLSPRVKDLRSKMETHCEKHGTTMTRLRSDEFWRGVRETARRKK